MLTENQIDSAAISYCRELGLNPWEQITDHSAGDIGDNPGPTDQYKLYVMEVRKAFAMQVALKVGRSTPADGPEVEDS